VEGRLRGAVMTQAADAERVEQDLHLEGEASLRVVDAQAKASARRKGRPPVSDDTVRVTTRIAANVHLAMKTKAIVEGLALGGIYMRALDGLDAQPRLPFFYAVPDGSPNVQISLAPAALERARAIADAGRVSLSNVFLTAGILYLGKD